MRPFHLAIPVADLDLCRRFYRDVLGCQEGRSDDMWVDFNFYGHQLVIHKKEGFEAKRSSDSNIVDGHEVPIPHFGVVLNQEDWGSLADKLRSIETTFVIEPCIRFKGEAGEQSTMFFLDPEGNALEFKSFKNMDNLFAK